MGSLDILYASLMNLNSVMLYATIQMKAKHSPDSRRPCIIGKQHQLLSDECSATSFIAAYK